MSLEFSEAMFNEMEELVGKKQILPKGKDVVDSDVVVGPTPKHCG